MSDFFHGAKAGKQATSVSTPTTADSSIHFIVGTAPVHMVGGKVNEPVYASSYAEAVAAMGYSEDWKKYDICEEIDASYQKYSNAPIVMVIVLDPKKHLAGETTADLQLAGNVLDLPLEALADTVKVKGYQHIFEHSRLADGMGLSCRFFASLASPSSICASSSPVASS